jgi:hypothetical protein
MLTVATLKPRPEAEGPKTFKLPKRVARARRVMESKRLDSFREIHEALKKTAREEQEFLKGFFKNTQDMWSDDVAEAAADEEAAEIDDE